MRSSGAPGPTYNALALSLREQAVKRARDVDDDIKRGRFRSALQGIPFGAKDLLAYAGHPTTWGAKPYAGQVFDYTATVIKKIEKGAVCLQASCRWWSWPADHIPLRGSVSTRPGAQPVGSHQMVRRIVERIGSVRSRRPGCVSLGSETSGSILTPSAFCGVTGLRPTYGLVSRHGAMPLSWTLDKIGPMCRSAEDADSCSPQSRAVIPTTPARLEKAFTSRLSSRAA